MGIFFIRKSINAASDPERGLDRDRFPGVAITLFKCDFKVLKSIHEVLCTVLG